MENWILNFERIQNNDINFHNEFNLAFPEQSSESKSPEETRKKLIQSRNDLNFPNKDCECDEKCDYKGLCKLLKKTESEIMNMGYSPYDKLGKCGNFHFCFALCDACIEEKEGVIRCKKTGRVLKSFAECDHGKITNRKGKVFTVYQQDNTTNLLNSKKNFDQKYGKKYVEIENFEWKGFKNKKERKIRTKNINLKFDISKVFSLIKKFTFNDNFDEYNKTNTGVPFYIFSKELNHFFRNITKEQLLISLGYLNVSTLLSKFKNVKKTDLDIIKIFEHKMLTLLPGFRRILNELDSIVTTQKKQYAECYKYLTDECRLKKKIPDFFNLYNKLYFDNKWHGDKLNMFPTWKEWIEILEKSIKIWLLCKISGNDKKIKSISVVPEDLIVSILSLQSDGWKFNNTMVIERNLYLSELFCYLRLNRFSKYGINLKIHNNGMKVVTSSLEYLCQYELGVKYVADFLNKNVF